MKFNMVFNFGVFGKLVLVGLVAGAAYGLVSGLGLI
jgi:hypothetical protein